MKEDAAGVMIKEVQQIKVGNGRERDEGHDVSFETWVDYLFKDIKKKREDRIELTNRRTSSQTV